MHTNHRVVLKLLVDRFIKRRSRHHGYDIARFAPAVHLYRTDVVGAEYQVAQIEVIADKRDYAAERGCRAAALEYQRVDIVNKYLILEVLTEQLIRFL